MELVPRRRAYPSAQTEGPATCWSSVEFRSQQGTTTCRSTSMQVDAEVVSEAYAIASNCREQGAPRRFTASSKALLADDRALVHGGGANKLKDSPDEAIAVFEFQHDAMRQLQRRRDQAAGVMQTYDLLSKPLGGCTLAGARAKVQRLRRHAVQGSSRTIMASSSPDLSAPTRGANESGVEDQGCRGCGAKRRDRVAARFTLTATAACSLCRGPHACRRRSFACRRSYPGCGHTWHCQDHMNILSISIVDRLPICSKFRSSQSLGVSRPASRSRHNSSHSG